MAKSSAVGRKSKPLPSDSSEDSSDSGSDAPATPPPSSPPKKKKSKKKSKTSSSTAKDQEPNDHAPAQKASREREEDPEPADAEPRKRARVAAEYDRGVVRAFKAWDSRAKHDTRVSNGYEHHFMKAREAVRKIGEFVNYDSILTQGLQRGLVYDNTDPEYIESPHEWTPYWEARIMFRSLLLLFPDISTHVSYLRQHPHLVGEMASFLSSVAGKARSDDVGRVKKVILSIAGLSDVKEVAEKTNRGFKHPATGRLLCPMILLDEFDEDPEGFCRKVRDISDDRTEILGSDWAALYYDHSKYDPDDVRAGFLRSKIVLDTIKLIYTGPSSINDDSGAKNKGKPPLAKIYNITRFDTILPILYAASLARFALNSQDSWDNNDDEYKGLEFVHSVINTSLRDEDWEAEPVTWYNERVFDNAPFDDRPPKKRETAFTRMLAQDAARRAKREAEAAATASAVEAAAAAAPPENRDLNSRSTSAAPVSPRRDATPRARAPPRPTPRRKAKPAPQPDADTAEVGERAAGPGADVGEDATEGSAAANKAAAEEEDEEMYQ